LDFGRESSVGMAVSMVSVGCRAAGFLVAGPARGPSDAAMRENAGSVNGAGCATD